MALSSDKKWVMVSPYGSPAQLIAIPTGAGERRELTHDYIHHLGGRWLPNQDAIIIFAGNQPNHGLQYFVQRGASAAPVAITPENVRSAAQPLPRICKALPHNTRVRTRARRSSGGASAGSSTGNVSWYRRGLHHHRVLGGW